MQKPELLAPGGTPHKAKLALHYGADAVYCGTNIFALRQHSGNFNYHTLKEVVDYAHKLGKKVYVVVNVFAHNHHINVLKKAFEELRNIAPDALIISDAGVFSLARELVPEIPIHISTQASVTNALGVKFWADQGAKRVILARELNVREIKEIHEQYPNIEIETFVHGAQCMAYSGRCMLSAYMTDSNKANHGSCANSCRWQYLEVTESQRPNEVIRIEEDEFGTYIFNAHDMCMIEHLDVLADAGIISFKVEGRGRSALYAAQTIKFYREAIDLIGDTSESTKQHLKELRSRLEASSTRDFDTGFFFGSPKQSIIKRDIKPTHKFVGQVIEVIDEHTARVLVKNEIYQGETIHVLTPQSEFTIQLDKLILAKNKAEVASAHGGKQDEIIIQFTQPIDSYTLLWLDTNQRTKTEL